MPASRPDSEERVWRVLVGWFFFLLDRCLFGFEGVGLTSGIGIERTVAGPTASMRKRRLALIVIVE